MDIEKYFEEQKIEPVQDRKDGMDYWTNYELFTYNDLMECMEDLVKKMSVMRSCKSDSELLCECGGNERVALDCTMNPCKHPKYYNK